MARRVRVVGAGVIGLTTAVLLSQRGDRVSVWSADPPLATTSAVAAAVWYPYRVEPAERVLPWSAASLQVFAELAREPAAAVRWCEVLELFREPVADPWWREAVPTFGRAAPGVLPPGYADGYALRLPVVVMDRYLGYLQDRVAGAGGAVTMRLVGRLEEAAAGVDAVVSCVGTGARQLLPDPAVYPVRGQVVVVRNPGIERCLLDTHNPAGVTYVIPRGDDCVLGGTVEQDEWGLEPSPIESEAILRRCTALEPRLSGAEVLEHRVGLRPGRRPVRLDVARLDDGTPVVHQHGHGGAGVTLSWGSAAEAVGLLDEALA